MYKVVHTDWYGNLMYELVDFKRIITYVYNQLLVATKDFAQNRSHVKTCECTDQHYILEYYPPVFNNERCPKIAVINPDVCNACDFFPGRLVNVCAQYHYVSILLVIIMCKKHVTELPKCKQLQEKYEALCTMNDWLFEQCSFDVWTGTLAKEHPVAFLNYFLQGPITVDKMKAYLRRPHKTRDKISPQLQNFVAAINSKTSHYWEHFMLSDCHFMI